ncbi:hypothetical protein DCAR_0830694 [Daucus carota subsp. sativus]|uniref:Uncharacterized protein n=1 Tax=Daucus carota subsp. sativus TaxID=79200 RepID=A0A175YK33_DAUCS|nr:hypothetical protein DCAR_0830694 [Daucus carota subsp. sativus]
MKNRSEVGDFPANPKTQPKNRTKNTGKLPRKLSMQTQLPHKQSIKQEALL